MAELSIVIPNWNGQALLAKHLPAVIKACRKWAPPAGRLDWEIIVVDDASTDDSVTFLKKKYPQIKLVVHHQNQRFAAACNSGVKKARGKMVVLLNNDVSPEPNFLKPLVKHFKDPQIFAVGCKERNWIGGRMTYGGRGQGEFRRGFLVHWRAKDQNRSNTLWANGGNMVVDRKKWLELGGMDTLYRPTYWEDIDLSWRAAKRGWQVLFEPQSVVNHRHETTNIAAFGRKGMKKFAYKNQFLFVWKNGDVKMLLAHLFWLPYHLLKAILAGDYLFWLGFFLALKQLPEAIRARFK